MYTSQWPSGDSLGTTSSNGEFRTGVRDCGLSETGSDITSHPVLEFCCCTRIVCPSGDQSRTAPTGSSETVTGVPLPLAGMIWSFAANAAKARRLPSGDQAAEYCVAG